MNTIPHSKIRAILICIVFIACAFAGPDKGTIYWSKDINLTWDDFRENEGINNSAFSSLMYREEISYYSLDSINMDSVIAVAIANFYKPYSYVQPDKKNPYFLINEEGKFDIAEIYARKLRKELKKYNPKNRDFKKIENDINTIDNKILAEWDNERKLYAAETTNPRNEEKQKKWNERIAKELKELDQYADASPVKIIIP